MVSLVQHTRDCPNPGMGHSDAAKRTCDTYVLHRIADPYGSLGKWFAVNLGDGTGDNRLYDSKREAIINQRHNESWYAFIQVTMAQMTVCSAEGYLAVLRRMREAGIDIPDPDDVRGSREVIKRSSSEDQLALIRGKAVNLKMPREME
jgi:hypothetical protein